MRFVTFDDGRVGFVVDDTVVDATDVVADRCAPVRHSLMRTLIARWDDVEADVRACDRRLPLASVRLRPPLDDPTKIVAAPINYFDHQAEMNVNATVDALGFFLKAPSSIIGPSGTVELPYHGRRFDQEGELAVVIGRRARRISEAEALDHIFGYTGLLDMTMRGGEDRSTRKSFETFTPIGPWIVTPDELEDPDSIDVRCWVNGELRQSANTRDLVWGVRRFVAYASWVTTLEPGDVVTTGTPAGVGPVCAGDTIELELSGIGRLAVAVDDKYATESHTQGHDRGPGSEFVRSGGAQA